MKRMNQEYFKLFKINKIDRINETEDAKDPKQQQLKENIEKEEEIKNQQNEYQKTKKEFQMLYKNLSLQYSPIIDPTQQHNDPQSEEQEIKFVRNSIAYQMHSYSEDSEASRQRKHLDIEQILNNDQIQIQDVSQTNHYDQEYK